MASEQWGWEGESIEDFSWVDLTAFEATVPTSLSFSVRCHFVLCHSYVLQCMLSFEAC